MPLHDAGVREFREVHVVQPDRGEPLVVRPAAPVADRIGFRRVRVAFQYRVGYLYRLAFAQSQQQPPSHVVRQ
ncbi:hypothetical protein ACFQL4_26680 [Halosimplex aquaticum]